VKLTSVRNVFLTFLASLLSLSSIGMSNSSAIAFPAKESVSVDQAPFLATIWTTQKNAPDELEWNNGYICGAVMYTNFAVITAAHCVVGKDGKIRQDLVVMAGREMGYVGETLSVFNWKVHPRFSLKTGVNDIAFALLNHDSSYGTKQPLKIASKFQKSKTWLYGWGLDQNRQAPITAKRILQEDYTKYGSDFFEDFNAKTMIAAGYENRKEKIFGGACFGDSGSPLVIMNGTKPEILGIVSNGADECDSRVPSVYTRMSFYKSFIDDSMKKSMKEYQNLGLTASFLEDFQLGFKKIQQGAVLPYKQGSGEDSVVTEVPLQSTTKNNAFTYSDIFKIAFEARGKRGNSQHTWLLRIYLKAGKDPCDLRSESETRVSIGTTLPAAVSYTFLIPRERGKCFDTSESTNFISTEKSEWFSVAPADKALFEQGRCQYPSYRPMMMSEFWADADPRFVGGWEIKLDPKCQSETSWGPFIRTMHFNYRTQLSDTEPGLAMWIGPFKTQS
jgi:V8-like Glu-specific endopeptidase